MTEPARGGDGPEAVARVVAEAVAGQLAVAGSPLSSAHVLLDDPQLRNRDFAALGLNSIDWMEMATTIENTFGIEFPDEMLLDGTSRSVAGWSDHIQRLCHGPDEEDS